MQKRCGLRALRPMFRRIFSVGIDSGLAVRRFG
jgi:hypothetical protein